MRGSWARCRHLIHPCCSHIGLLPRQSCSPTLLLSLFLGKAFRKRKREGRRGGRTEEGRSRKERGAEEDAMSLHPPGPRKWGRELLFSCQESPWRPSTGLFMINTPRQLSSWSLLKYTLYYLNTMIFRAERSRWGVGEESGPVTRAVAPAGFPPSPRR